VLSSHQLHNRWLPKLDASRTTTILEQANHNSLKEWSLIRDRLIIARQGTQSSVAKKVEM